MEVWVGEIGVWWLFQVMTVVAQVMEMVARGEGAAPEGVA